jgi:DNA (cytosine-5)-methyltransferase 1
MTHLDLFTGIGGFHLAAGWAGFETVGFSEIEPYCCRLLAEKWPQIPNYGDIRGADFSGLRGGVTVLSAGVPCQPASLAGKRRGASDDRWLWEAVLDIVESVEPAWVVLENPPGILTLDEFGGVLLRLESLGYAVRAFSVPANAVGAKHRRQRIFIVANRDSGFQRECSKPGRWNQLGNGSEALADTASRGIRCGLSQWETRQPARSGEALADADRSMWQKQRESISVQSQFGSVRCSCSQDERVRFRLTEPPLCRRTDGIPNRSHRLKALGNAVVPAQAYPFFAAIAEVERMNCV